MAKGTAGAAGLFLLAAAAAGAGAGSPLPAAEPLTGHGLLRPEAEIALTARTAGLVVSVPRVEGDPAKAGEPVVILDDADAASNLVLARADLEAAELNAKKLREGFRPEDLERAQALYEEAKAGLDLAEKTLKSDVELAAGGFLSELGRQRTERSLEAARANAESRRLDLAILKKGSRPEDIRLAEIEVERRRAILAEREREAERRRIAGTREGRAFVSRVWAEPGQWVEAGKTVAELVYMDRVRIELDLPPGPGLALRRGTAAEVRSASFPGVVLAARVDRVSPVVDPASGTVRVVVLAGNPDLALRPGVEAEVVITP